MKGQNDKKFNIGRATSKAAEKKLNCRNAENCPLNGNCLAESLVYRAKVEPIKSLKKSVH